MVIGFVLGLGYVLVVLFDVPTWHELAATHNWVIHMHGKHMANAATCDAPQDVWPPLERMTTLATPLAQ